MFKSVFRNDRSHCKARVALEQVMHVTNLSGNKEDLGVYANAPKVS